MIMRSIGIGGLFAPISVFAAQIGAEYTNPLRFNTVDGLVTSILNAMQLSIVTLAVVFIVIGGILYIFSAGNESRITLAKSAFTAALIGLAIGIAAPTFLLEIYKILGATNTPAVVSGAPRIAQIISNVLEFLLGIAGTLALIAMVIGGIMYLAAGGDENRIDTGKKIFKSAIVGMIIIMASLVIVRAIGGFFVGSGNAAARNGIGSENTFQFGNGDSNQFGNSNPTVGGAGSDNNSNGNSGSDQFGNNDLSGDSGSDQSGGGSSDSEGNNGLDVPNLPPLPPSI